MKKRFTEEEIISFLRQADAGTPIKESCRQLQWQRPSQSSLQTRR